MNNFYIGPYHFMKLLGRGSFGEVYLASNQGELYACKVIETTDLEDNQRTALDREMQAYRSFHSRYVVHSVEDFDWGSKHCVVLEYCPSDLDKLIMNLKRNKKYLSEKGVCNVMVHSLYGLDYIHSHHSIHRDIKPGNILITCDGVAVIGDLGLTKIISNDLPIKQTLCGTPSYMAPEILQKKNYNCNVDIWSLGCTLYELCTLKPAFKGNWGQLPELQKDGIKDEIPTLYSNGLRTMILHMLTYNSKKRPSAEELLKHEYIQHYIEREMGNSYDCMILENISKTGCRLSSAPSTPILTRKNYQTIESPLTPHPTVSVESIFKSYYENVTKGHSGMLYSELLKRNDEDVLSIDFTNAYKDGCLLFPSDNSYKYCEKSKHLLTSKHFTEMQKFWSKIVQNMKDYFKFLGFKWNPKTMKLKISSSFEENIIHYASVENQYVLLTQFFYSLKYFDMVDLQETFFDLIQKDICSEEGHKHAYIDDGTTLLKMLLPTLRNNTVNKYPHLTYLLN